MTMWRAHVLAQPALVASVPRSLTGDVHILMFTARDTEAACGSIV